MSIKRFVTRVRRQYAVYWKRNVPDKYGRYGFDDPIEIKCRWADVQEMRINADGEAYRSTAEVIVDRAMSIGDRLWLGQLQSDTPADPLTLRDAFEIKETQELPDLKAKYIVNTVYL